MLVGCGPQQTGTSATPTLNAEAQTAEALPQNPTAASGQAAEAATAEIANTAVAAGGGGVQPACVVRPEVTEGPDYVDVDLVRSDIRTDSSTGAQKAGTPLVLTFNVSQVSESACTPLEGATVEIWDCGCGGSTRACPTPASTLEGQELLRGAQMTDASGWRPLRRSTPAGTRAGRPYSLQGASRRGQSVYSRSCSSTTRSRSRCSHRLPIPVRRARLTRSTAPTASTRTCCCWRPRRLARATLRRSLSRIDPAAVGTGDSGPADLVGRRRMAGRAPRHRNARMDPRLRDPREWLADA